MCTVVVLCQPSHRFPLQLIANRDERIDRGWDPPAAYWPAQPDVTAGRDRSAGGTWLGMNQAGVVAAILNRAGTLGSVLGKRSRGELPLLALRHRSAAEAAAALTRIDASAWRDFNMVIADRYDAVFVRGTGDGHPTAERLQPGVSMVTAYDPNDPASPRVARHLPHLRANLPDGPECWGGWRDILADRSGSVGEQINVVPRGGFGTVSASMIAIPAEGSPTWLFSAGPPHLVPFLPVTLATEH